MRLITLQRATALMALLALAGCTSRPEIRLLNDAGVESSITCADAEGVERMSFCAVVLTNTEADQVAERLGLKSLARPERHGAVTNMLNLPFECRLLLFDKPLPMILSGVFDSPYALNESHSSVQYASVVLARHPLTGQSCFTFTRDFR